jgi:hypothetical protein
MAAIASLRYFLLICFHLAFRFSLPWSGNPLFYDVTTKISVDLALFGAMDSLSQGRILNPFLPGKALKPLGFEDSHVSP